MIFLSAVLCFPYYTAVLHGQNTGRTQLILFWQLRPCPHTLSSRAGLPLSWRNSCKVSSDGLVVWCFWKAPAISKQCCCSLVPTSCSACSPLSVLGPPPLAVCYLPPSGWLKRQGKKKRKGTSATKCLTVPWLCSVYQLLDGSSHPGGGCISMEKDAPPR